MLGPKLRSRQCTAALVIPNNTECSGAVKIANLYLQGSKLGQYLRIGYPISQCFRN